MINIIYFVIAFLATTIGSIAGLGGGVIIKPLFDLIGFHSISDIGLYSSITVFAMSVVSVYKQFQKGFKIDIKIIVWISVGSFIGGILGENIFRIANSAIESPKIVPTIQASVLILVLIGILIQSSYENRFKTYVISNYFLIFLLGALLGIVSVFLGIGGGPLNIAAFTIFFSLPLKDSIVYSLATILFSQSSKLGQFIIFDLSTSTTDFNVLPFIITAAILGGIVGTKINLTQDEAVVKKIYKYTIIFLILISVLNILKLWVL